MEFDESHQMLKAQLIAAFDRASRSVDSTCKKTKDIRVAFDEESKNEDSRLFKLTRRLNAEGDALDNTREGESDEEEEVLNDYVG